MLISNFHDYYKITANTKTPSLSYIGLVFALTATMFIPFFLSAPLPLSDLPNHIARMHIIAHLDESAFLQRHYRLDWQLLPNLAMDVIVPPLAKIMSAELATTLFVAFTMVATVSGVITLHKKLFGYWSLFPFIVFLFVYHRALIWGFVNYLFTFSLSLWLFIVWLDIRQRAITTRIPLFAALNSLLYLLHLHAFCMYAVLLGSYEITKALQKGESRFSAKLLALSINALPFGPAIALFFFASPTSEYSVFSWGTITNKLIGLADPFNLYLLPFDLAVFAVVGGALLLGLVTGRITIHRDMILALFLFSLIYLLMPRVMFGSYGADRRILPIALIIAAASLDFRKIPVGGIRGSVMVICLLFAIKTAVVSVNWAASGKLYREVRQSMAALEQGAHLAVAVARLEQPFLLNPPVGHIAAMAAVDRDAYVNMLFIHPNHQILRVLHDIDDKGCCSHHYIVRNVKAPGSSLFTMEDPFARIPLEYFDNFLVFGLRYLPAPPPSKLERISGGTDWALFRINNGSPRSDSTK